ncbi:MAG: zf-HC2 domain-containing protein, partial [Gemmatimonadota bacterium]
ADGELSPAQRAEIAEHLLGCLICRAQHAEVGALRDRATALLAIAVPGTLSRRDVTPVMPARSARRRWPRLVGAAAVALIGAGIWYANPWSITGGDSQLATSLGGPHLFGQASGPDSAGILGKQITMTARTISAPQVTGGAGNGQFAVTPTLGAPTEVDPVFTSDWTSSSFDDAVNAGGGSLARVTGVAIAGVRMHPSAIGGRPTFMIRQQLPDGRPVWVFEGLEEDITPVNQVLQASGIAMSMVKRTKADYVGTGADLHITTRMVTVVGYLPVDSLNALVARLALR